MVQLYQRSATLRALRVSRLTPNSSFQLTGWAHRVAVKRLGEQEKMKTFGLNYVLMAPAGEGEGGGAVPLTEAQKAEINTMLNGAVAGLKKEVSKQFETFGTQFGTMAESLTGIQTALTTLQTPPVDDKKKKAGEGDGLSPEANAKMLDLTKQIETLTKGQKANEDARKAAEDKALKTATESALRTALGEFTFVNPEAAQDAFTLILPDVKAGENGAFIANDLPLGDYVKDLIGTKKAHLLAPVGRSGSGAGNGGGQPGGKGSPTLEGIKLGMSPADQAAAAGAIKAALAQA